MASIILLVILLSVLPPPADSIEFTRVPSDQTVQVGGTVTFHCAVTNKGDTHVYWQKNKSVYLSRDRNVTMYSPIHPKLTERLAIVGRRNNRDKFSLRIYDVQPQDAGIYQCVYFENMFSSYSPAARLTVLPRSKPTLSCRATHFDNDNETEMTDAEKIGTNVKLICEEFFVGNQQNLSSLYWYKQGDPFHLFSPQYCITTSGSQRCVYIKPISKADLDVPYVCVKNGLTLSKGDACQTTPFNSSINVNVSPLAPVHYGDSATFICSTPDLLSIKQYEWFVNGNPVQIERDDFIYQWNFDRITLENINQADNGTILTCVLHGDNGALGKGSAVVLVQGNDIATNTVITTTTTDSAYYTTKTSTTITATATDSTHVSTKLPAVIVTTSTADAPVTSTKFPAGRVTLKRARSREIMDTVATERYGVFSPRNTSNLEDDLNLDYNVTDTTSTMEGVTETTPDPDEGVIALNDFFLVITASAVIFAAMCLLVLCNIACYIAYKKHKAWRKRRNQRRYPLDQIRPGLDDSVMLENLSPDTRREQKQPVVAYQSDTDGKQIPSPQSSRKADTIFEDSDSSGSQGPAFSSFHTNSSSGSSSRASSKRNYKRKLPSAPVISENSETCVEIENNPYRVLDPLRSDSLIESVKQREREDRLQRENIPRPLKFRNLSSSSTECLSPTIPSYKRQISARRKCVSLSHGVVPPWHRKGYDANDDPAYAVVNVVGHMRPSRSFCHNRPRSAFEPRLNHQRIDSTRSLHDPPIRIKPDRRPPPGKYDIGNRQPAPIPAAVPRKPARMPPNISNSSDYDNFRSAAAAGVTLVPEIRPKSSHDTFYLSSSDDEFTMARSNFSKKVAWDGNSPVVHSLAHSDPEIDQMHSQHFFPDQPLPKTPMSPANDAFDFTKRRLSGEGSKRRDFFVQRQRSFSDSFTGKEAHCALDDIGETFTGNEPLSSSSSETRLDFLPEKSPPLRKKVLLRQKELSNKARAGHRPISEPVPHAEFARVYPRLSDPTSDEESLTAFPPYRP